MKKTASLVRYIETTALMFKLRILETNSWEILIPAYFYEERKKIVIRPLIVHWTRNKFKSSSHELNNFIADRYIFVIVWSTKKIRQIFRLKDKKFQFSHVVYQGTCSCGETYIGETSRNLKTRTTQHENPRHNSEPAKHLKECPNHKFIGIKLHTEHCILNVQLQGGY